jgi:tetratricopeptide (TPR) repeat protein
LEIPPGQEVAVFFGRGVPFVGRRGDVDALYQHVRGALQGHQLHLAWLTGTAGSGKTRLLQELQRVVAPEQRGIGWWWLDADPTRPGLPTLAARLALEVLGGSALLAAPQPQQAVVEALSTLWRQQPGTPTQLPVPFANDVLALVGQQPLQPGASAPDLHGGAAVAARLLSIRLQKVTGVLVLDAVPDAVDAVGRLLDAVMAQCSQQALAVVVACPTEPPAALSHLATVRPLFPLDPTATQALAKHLLAKVQQLPQALAEELAQSSAGNPQRLLDSVSGLITGGQIVYRNGQWLWSTQTARGPAVQFAAQTAPQMRRLAQLPEHLRPLSPDLLDVLDAAAFFGTSAPMGGVLSVIRGGRADPRDSVQDADRTALMGRLQRLGQADVLHVTGDAHFAREALWRFVHPSDPAALLAAMEDEKRRLYGRLCGQWLANRPKRDPIADHGRIAELFEQGGRFRQAASHYLEAGHAARNVGEWQRSLALYAAGSRLARADDADLASDLAVAHGGALLRLSRFAEAEQVLRVGLHMALCLDDDARAGTAQLRLGQVARQSGRYQAAGQHLHESMSLLKASGAHKLVADVSDELGLLEMTVGGPDAYQLAMGHFLKALALRRRAEDRRVVARSLTNLARVHIGRGHYKEAQDALAEAQTTYLTIGDQWGAAEAKMVQGEAQSAAGRFKHALASWDEAFALAREVGDKRRQLEIVLLQADTRIVLGEWQVAAGLLVEVADLVRDITDPELLSALYRVQAAISLERSALETAELDSDRAVEVALTSGAKVSVAKALLVRACVLGTKALGEQGGRTSLADRKATEAFEESLNVLREVGDVTRQLAGLRSYAAYLQQRGAGTKLQLANSRIRELERELAVIAGNA